VTVNRRRGFTRLALALGIPYFGWWALTWWFASSALPRHLQWSREASERGDWKTATVWMEIANKDTEAVHRALTWGVIVPILALFLGVIAYWVYRGFKPRN